MRRWLVGTVVALVTTTSLLPFPAAYGATVLYAETPRAGWSTNGVGRAVLVVGDTVYVGGNFTAAVAPGGGSSVSRSNLAAFDLATGELRATFVADTNGSVRALASNGTSLFVGGMFTTINGVARSRLAAVDLTTGAVKTGFQADASSNVYGLDVYNNRLYVAGSFTTLAGSPRRAVGAVRTVSGVIEPAFNPSADATAHDIVVSPDGTRVYVGGRFLGIAFALRPRLAAVDRLNGTITGPTFVGLEHQVLDVDIASGGMRVFAAVGGDTNKAIAWGTNNGAQHWSHRVDGDVQAIHQSGGNVYFGFHQGYQGDTTTKLLAADATTGALTSFRPSINSFWGVRAIDSTAGALAIAGEFSIVNGVSTRGIAVFPGDASGQTLIATGATWRYRDNGSNQGTAWRATMFDDSSWATGPAELGYGEGDEATVVSFGPNPSNKYITTYFRHSFTLDSTVGISDLDISLVRDDGAVVYLNGVEVARTNMPGGTISSSTLASSTIGDASVPVLFDIDQTLLQPGTNTIAVEIHQVSATSSDISFSLELST
jgi:hypothetical protein